LDFGRESTPSHDDGRSQTFPDFLVLVERLTNRGGLHLFDGLLLRSCITYGVRDRRLLEHGRMRLRSFTTQSSGCNRAPV
jgi:hypothetical protein